MAVGERPRGTGRSRLAAWILLGGALGTVAAFGLARTTQTRQATARFDAAVAEARERLHERLGAGEDLLRGIRGFVQSGGHLDRQAFRTFTRAMDIEGRHAGLLGVSYGVPLAPGGDAAILARLAA